MPTVWALGDEKKIQGKVNECGQREASTEFHRKREKSTQDKQDSTEAGVVLKYLSHPVGTTGGGKRRIDKKKVD